MNILIYSPLFYPSIGGLETVMSILAHEFVAQGHGVKVVSQTPDPQAASFPFEVIRHPTLPQLYRLATWCEVYLQGCVSLKGLWPALVARKPLAVTHQTWYLRTSAQPGWQDYLKQWVTRFAINIAVSGAIANHLAGPSTLIPNPYRDDLFGERTGKARDRELIFLGRLVSDKGADLLLEALALLRQQGLAPRLTLVGGGVEEAALKHQASTLGVASQVEFVGPQVGPALVELLNAHQILVVPSRWPEPFGIVALEGIACGCVVVGTAGGGLSDAIGPCGITVANGDVPALAAQLARLLTNPEQWALYRKHAPDHLHRHRPSVVASAYLRVFEEAMR